MRIAFVTNNYYPYSAGVVSSIQTSIKALQAQGHEVRVITLDFLGTEHHHDAPTTIRLPTIGKCIYKHNHLAIPWRAYHFMLAALKNFKPDIIHSHHPFILGITALRCARTLQIPIVFTFHTMYDEYTHYVPLPASICRAFVHHRVKRYGNAVNAIIAPSPAIVDYIRHFGIKTPITIIPSGLQDIFVHQSLPHKPSIETGLCSLLLVSRFTQEKNIPFILRALALAQKKCPKKCEATLAGYGYATNDLQSYAYQQLGLPHDTVHFIINPSQQEIAQLYANADIFLFASAHETQGLVLIEAMAGGAVVISIDGLGQHHLIHDKNNGFLIKDEKEMCEKICLLINDARLRATMQSNAWHTAQGYTGEHMGKELTDLYTKILCTLS